jgi:hypothetical protein
MLKKIKNIDGYFIDDAGQVWSAWHRSITRGEKGKIIGAKMYEDKLRPVKSSLDKRGYLEFRRGNRRYKIHRLLAECFIPNATSKKSVCHYDDNKLNIKLTNLYWCDQKDNMADREKNGKGNRGEKHGMSKLTRKQVREIRSKYKDHTAKEIAPNYGITPAYIYQLTSRDRWRHCN